MKLLHTVLVVGLLPVLGLACANPIPTITPMPVHVLSEREVVAIIQTQLRQWGCWVRMRGEEMSVAPIDDGEWRFETSNFGGGSYFSNSDSILIDSGTLLDRRCIGPR